MTQLPAAFCRSFSFISALLLPNSFMASLLSDGWKKATIWSRRKLVGDARSDDASTSRNGDISSFGVPYRRAASRRRHLGVPYRLMSSPMLANGRASRSTSGPPLNENGLGVM